MSDIPIVYPVIDEENQGQQLTYYPLPNENTHTFTIKTSEYIFQIVSNIYVKQVIVQPISIYCSVQSVVNWLQMNSFEPILINTNTIQINHKQGLETILQQIPTMYSSVGEISSSSSTISNTTPTSPKSTEISINTDQINRNNHHLSKSQKCGLFWFILMICLVTIAILLYGRFKYNWFN